MATGHILERISSYPNLQRSNAAPKQQEIQEFDALIFDNGAKTSKVLFFSEESEINKQDVDLTNETEELKGGKEALSKILDENESRLDSLEKKVEQNRINLEKKIKEIYESHAKILQELEDEIERLIDEADHSYEIKVAETNEANERLNKDITTLEKNNVLLEDVLKKSDETQSKFCQSGYYCELYIGEVCLYLLANMYHYVLPNQFAEDLPYEVKDIEEDIKDEDLLETQEEREKASERWEDLKKKLSWDPSLEESLRMLQKEGGPIHPPEGLTVREAERVAEEMNQQGSLRGRTSYERVKKLIQMWKTSATLVQSLQ